MIIINKKIKYNNNNNNINKGTAEQSFPRICHVLEKRRLLRMFRLSSICIVEHDPLSFALLENHHACQRKDALNHRLFSSFILPAPGWVQLLLLRSQTANSSVKDAVKSSGCHLSSDSLDLLLLVHSDDDPSVSSSCEQKLRVLLLIALMLEVVLCPLQAGLNTTQLLWCSSADILLFPNITSLFCRSFFLGSRQTTACYFTQAEEIW